MTRRTGRDYETAWSSRRNCRAGDPIGSGPSELQRHALEPAPVVRPPTFVPGGHVVATGPQAGGSVDELSNDVGMPRMPVRLRRHVDEDPVQRDLAAIVRPPRDATACIERQRADRFVRVLPRTVIQPDDPLTRLISGGPHVGVRLRVLAVPWQ